MGFIDEQQIIFGKVVEKGVRRASWRPAGEDTGIVLDPFAESDLLQHFHIVTGPLLNALGLQQHVPVPEISDPFLQLRLNLLHRRVELAGGRDEVGSRVDHHMAHHRLHRAGQGVNLRDPVDLIPEKFHPNGNFSAARRENLHHIPPDPELSPDEIDIVAVILPVHQLVEQLIPLHPHPRPQRDDHAPVVLRSAQGIDAADAGHDDDVIPLT